MSEPLRVEITADGSPTLFAPQFGAHYHSMHGALQESAHVFIQEGLSYYSALYQKTPIHILEYGMGTGLNVLLTWKYAQLQGLNINYHALEGYPVPSEAAKSIDYGVDDFNRPFGLIHQCQWDIEHQMSGHFNLTKQEILFEKFSAPQKYDIIYFDAFAPSCQPHLWEEPILRNTYNALIPKGILVTFCAKGSFKRNLRNLGFEVERVPGPPGKREMTRATRIG